MDHVSVRSLMMNTSISVNLGYNDIGYNDIRFITI